MVQSIDFTIVSQVSAGRFSFVNDLCQVRVNALSLLPSFQCSALLLQRWQGDIVIAVSGSRTSKAKMPRDCAWQSSQDRDVRSMALQSTSAADFERPPFGENLDELRPFKVAGRRRLEASPSQISPDHKRIAHGSDRLDPEAAALVKVLSSVQPWGSLNLHAFRNRTVTLMTYKVDAYVPYPINLLRNRAL
jgi:hypothetical protein